MPENIEAISTDPEIVLLYDYNGVISPQGRFVDHPLTEDALSRMQDLAQMPFPEGVTEHMRTVLTKRDNPTRMDKLMQPFVNRAGHWNVITASDRRLGRPSLREAASYFFMQKAFRKFIGTLTVLEDELKVMQSLADQKVKMTIVSSVPYAARGIFARRLDPCVWGCLNPEMSIIQRPIDWTDFFDPDLSKLLSYLTREQMGGAEYKTGIGLVLGTYGKAVWREDDYYNALCISRACNTVVYLNKTEEEAMQQSHVKELGLPPSLQHSTKGEVIFDPTGEKMCDNVPKKVRSYQDG